MHQGTTLAAQPKSKRKKDLAYQRILEMIQDGQVDDGHFPSEPEFCRQLGVSRVTLRNALLRLECEGMISRSHYYGTRVIRKVSVKKILVISNEPLNDKFVQLNLLRLQQVMAACRKHSLDFEKHELRFVSDPEKLAEHYSGIILFGAGFTGKERSFQILSASGLPMVYLREDEKNVIIEQVASVGCNVRQAWEAGFDYLTKLGFRRIATLIRDDTRSLQRLGYDRRSFSSYLKDQGYPESAKLVFNVSLDNFNAVVHKFVEAKRPEAIYCYSDYYAAHLFRVLYSMGKQIPEDIAVLGFGNGTTLLTPALSAVRLTSPVIGSTAVELLLWLQRHPNEHPYLNLPYQIVEHDRTVRIQLGTLLDSCIKQKEP